MTALGGISEIGRNMTVFEHLGRLLIVDCGVLFPGHDEPGVDLILPDLRHVEDRLDDVEALVLTHAHEDHIGAIPFLLKLRSDIPVVGSKFTLALVAEKCREHRIKPVFVEVAEGQKSTHGVFECQYFHVNHSIPGCLAIAIHTGAGTVLHTGDIKLDQLPLGRPADRPARNVAARRCRGGSVPLRLDEFRDPGSRAVGERGRPDAAPADPRRRGSGHRRLLRLECRSGATDHRRGGGAGPARCRSSAGRWCATWASPASSAICTSTMTIVLDIGAAEMMPPERVVLITTGTQGEPMAALSRMSRGEHRSITLTAGDLIILSSSLIPGNEEAVFGVIDALAKIGARVVTNQQARVHVSGHAYAGELLFLYNGVRPRNVMPVHGTWRMMRANAALAARTGVPEENDRAGGERCQRRPGGGQGEHRGRRSPTGKMFVDGLITGDVGDATLGERLILSSGFIAVTVVVRRGTGKSGGPGASAFAGFLGGSQGAGAGRRARSRKSWKSLPPRTSPSHPDRPGGPSRRRQVGGGDLPPAADDRADGHRDLVHRTVFQQALTRSSAA